MNALRDIAFALDHIHRYPDTPDAKQVIDDSLADLRQLLDVGSISREEHAYLGKKLWDIREAICDSLLRS